jgi:3-hydroxyisobutyrate dehydrogenase
MKVSIIGVGDMGIDIARHVHTAGFDLMAFDLSEKRCQQARDLGIAVAGSVAEAVKGRDVHLVVVATDEQSTDVTEQILAAGDAGGVIAILATNHPNTMKTLAEQAGKVGFGFVDAPVAFGRKGAKEGTLASLCGGKAEHIERITPVLETYSRKVHNVGPSGAGQMAKACNNMLHWSACIANFEVLSLAKRYGLDAQRMRETLLECPGRNGTLQEWDDTRFTWHEKDMDLALDLAQAGGLPLPFYGHVDQLIKFFHADQVKDLLYGPESQYLGKPVKPLAPEDGGLGQ